MVWYQYSRLCNGHQGNMPHIRLLQSILYFESKKYVKQNIHDNFIVSLKFIKSPQYTGGLGGWYSVQKPMGVCRWPLKIGPQKIKGKMIFGAKKIKFC